MQCIYMWGEVSESNKNLKVPLTSAAVVFVLKYCQTDLFHVNFIGPTRTPKLKEVEHDKPVSDVNFKNCTSDSFEKDPVGEKGCLEKIPTDQSENDTSEKVPDDVSVRIPVCALSGLSHSFIREEELPVDVKNCALPVVQVNMSGGVRHCTSDQLLCCSVAVQPGCVQPGRKP